MFSNLFAFLLYEPRRIVTLGRALCLTGSFLIFVGLIGRVATASVAAIGFLGGRHLAYLSLGDIYPMLPTWWIPESVIGYVSGAVLVLLGLVITTAGSRLQRRFVWTDC